MNIAVAVDMSMESHFAVRWALDLRNRLRERGRPVHTYAITVPADVRDFQYRTLAGLPTATTDSSGTRHKITNQVRDFLRAVSYDVDDVEIVLDEGEPARVISEFCEQREIDWLAAGMDNSDALSRLMLGSTVHGLRERVPCNLVVVHPDHARLEDPLEIASGVDFLPGSDAAMFSAAELADLTGGHLQLVHALQEAPTGSSSRGLESRVPSEISRLEADARNSLDRMMGEVRRRYPDLEHTNVVAEGPARELLTDVVEQRNVGAVVLGKVEHSTFEKWFFGSVSRALLKKMPTTLVLVPPLES